MIKARGGSVVLLGLSRVNVDRLMEGKPIRFEGKEVGLPGITFVIMGGETEHEMGAQLFADGLVVPATIIDDRYTVAKPGDRGDHGG